jgi:LPS export ABC transporter protein LptC
MKPRECVFNIVKLIYRKIDIAALLSGAAILFFGCANDIEKIKAFSSPETLPVIYAENYETTFTDSGIVRFFLKTPLLMQYDNEGKSFREFPQGLELTRYDEQRRIVSRITARYAKQFEKENKWEAKNDVVAINLAGDTLKTDHLIWDEKQGKIYSDLYVKIIRPDQIITGIGFESDLTMEKWKIKNPRGTIYVEMNQGPTGAGDSLSVQPSGARRPVDIGP